MPLRSATVQARHYHHLAGRGLDAYDSAPVPFTPAGATSVVVFVLIVAGVLAAFAAAVRRAYADDPARRSRVLVGAGAYLAVLSMGVASGMIERLPLYGIPFFFGTVLAASLWAGLSSVGARLGAAVPVAALVLFQSFRLPLELVLHAWAVHGTIPSTMTWTGRNWDIVSGIVALAAAPLAARHRAAAWAANIVGLALLVNVMRVAMLSSPVPFGWDVTPPLVLALHLPYALVGPVCVGGALVGHIVLTRALIARRVAPSSAPC